MSDHEPKYAKLRGDDEEIEPVRLTFKDVDGVTEYRIWYSDGSYGAWRLGGRTKKEIQDDFDKVKAGRKDREKAHAARHEARRRNLGAE